MELNLANISLSHQLVESPEREEEPDAGVYALAICVGVVGFVAFGTLFCIVVWSFRGQTPVSLIHALARRMWKKCVDLTRRICRRGRRAPPLVDPEPQESGIQLQPLSVPPRQDASSPLIGGASSLPPVEGSIRSQASRSGLSTVREEDSPSLSSTRTLVPPGANAAASESAQTLVPTT